MGFGMDDFTLYFGSGFPSGPSFGFASTRAPARLPSASFLCWKSSLRSSAASATPTGTAGFFSAAGAAVKALMMERIWRRSAWRRCLARSRMRSTLQRWSIVSNRSIAALRVFLSLSSTPSSTLSAICSSAPALHAVR